MGDNVDMEIEEDEEEDDLDFNPLLRGETSSEASSSLSSENESPCNNVNKNIGSSLNRKIDFPSSGAMDKIRSCNRGSVSEDEEIVMLKSEVLTSSIQEVQILTNLEGICKGILSNCENDGADMMAEKNPLVEVCDQENNQKPVLDKDDIDCDDAICRRTRAQLSLANYTLEELEAFLQESDDDCDLQNVDEEEVYHKFLAAVLQEGDDKGQAEQGDGTFDEDEDNDADFEVELEELLESDVDETIGCSTEQNKKKDEEAHIPETRQKKRLKESMTRKKFHLGQAKARYRPLLPYVPNSQRSFLPPLSRPLSSAGLSHCSTSFSSADLICGLTNCQIGQLYCLIHEHVQLLLQVFSICVLDPSRHQVASDVRKLISEMVERREMALAWRKDPYPLLCFHPPNLHCSLQNDSNRMISCSWRPVVENPVFSILDVAPLQLAKIYLVDVKETESRHRKICLEDGHVKSHLKKEPLFALPMSSSVSNSSTEFVGRIITMPPALSPSSSCQLQSDHNQQPKKSLAATLVESTMRQSVALVPSDIAKLAQRFFHLFNAALFPHKPPTPAVANRVLFTDAEDGLLAMGLMEHNNDWLAIQQHFLPCKTTHQIFVRQKNRSSSKAPDNPIKAVKHMKASPLTEDEKALICDGLKIFKHDWISVWKCFVPHRDQSLLPRQYRIATGTQKSYKKPEAVKEQRRLYEAKRRKLKARMTDCQTPDKEVNDEASSECDMDYDDEAYVHEAFLEDLETGSSKILPQDAHVTKGSCRTQYRESNSRGTCGSIANYCRGPQKEMINVELHCNSSNSLKDVQSSQQLSHTSRGGHSLTQSFRTRKTKRLRLVKLAPDLPPVNLPPTVRVISQSAFKTYHTQLLYSKVSDNTIKCQSPGVPQVTKAGSCMISHVEKTINFIGNGFCSSNSDDGNNADHGKENASECDAQLHPLLFHAPSYFSLNCQSTSPSAHNLLPGPGWPASSATNAASLSSGQGSDIPINASTIEFHPLLRRTRTSDDSSALVSTIDGFSADLRAPQVTNFGQLTGTESVSECERMNRIDLDIHLSSTTDRQRLVELSDHQNVELNASPLEEGNVGKIVHSNPTSFILGDKDLEGSRTATTSVQPIIYSSKDGLSSETVHPSHAVSFQQCAGDRYEDSNAGIVMEKEELSDSEDENEDVVFECEYLEDSEEEESTSEQPTKIHNTALSFSGTNGKFMAAADLQLQQASSELQAAAKKGKGCSGAPHGPRGSQHANITRSRNVNGRTKRGKSSLRWLNTFSSPPSCLKKRAVEEYSILRDSGAQKLQFGRLETKPAGSKRLRRCSNSD